jgi:myo-inositol-1(or 4)-monophosphatase
VSYNASRSRERFDTYLKTATRAALDAGALLVRHVGRPRRVQTKRSAIDLVTELDTACELLIYHQLHRAFPDHGFYGEEHPALRSAAPSRWIVDPIDGTNNFVHGFPFFGISIGLEHHGAIVVGVIYDPMRRELFTAVRNGGAHCNGRRIRVSTTRRLAQSLLATGFSSRFRTRREPYRRWFEAFQCQSHGVRRMGSTVLCLAAVAAGRLEGFYERDLWPWDMAAGVLLVQEAGGQSTDLLGGPVDLMRGQLVASNGHIHAQMLRVIRPGVLRH